MLRKQKIYIAIPCFETMPVQFVSSITNIKVPNGYEISINFLSGSLVYDARNKLITKALDAGADYILWLDSDMVFEPDIIEKLLSQEVDFVSGVYYKRKPPFSPVLYKKLRIDETMSAKWEDYTHLPQGLFEIEGCGFGCVLMTAKLAKTVIDKYHLAFNPLPSLGEDLAFCLRARQAGFILYADYQIQLGHVANMVVTHESYEALEAAQDANIHQDGSEN